MNQNPSTHPLTLTALRSAEQRKDACAGVVRRLGATALSVQGVATAPFPKTSVEMTPAFPEPHVGQMELT